MEKKVNSAILVDDDKMVARTLTTVEEVEAHGFSREELARLEREGAISGFGGAAVPEESKGVGAFGPEGDEAEPDDLSSLTVAELRERAKDAGVEGYSSMNKAELVKALK